MVRESTKRANAKYDKTHCTGVFLKLNIGTDADILEKLNSVPNRQGYIKQLIRQDIAGSAPVSNTALERFQDPFPAVITEAIGNWTEETEHILSDRRWMSEDGKGV